MNLFIIVFVLIASLLAIWILVVRHLVSRIRAKRERPCFRCAMVATTEFMGLHYCIMCRMVVAQMLPAVRHDPPYGFPGAAGYLEFPAERLEVERKKES